MRIWDIEPEHLCRKHLLGEHRELHALYSIIKNEKKGYANHPETKRWVGKLGALYKRHAFLVKEMERRGYKHNSPLEDFPMTESEIQNTLIATIDEQKELLNNKNCECSF